VGGGGGGDSGARGENIVCFCIFCFVDEKKTKGWSRRMRSGSRKKRVFCGWNFFRWIYLKIKGE